MAGQKSHHPSTPKDDSSQVGVTTSHFREPLRPTGNEAADFGVPAAPSVSTLVDIYDSDVIDSAYKAKSHVVSCAIQKIGFGRYQVRSP